LANDPKISPCISVGVRESRPLLTRRGALAVVALKPASHGAAAGAAGQVAGDGLQAELLLRLADAAQEFLAEWGWVAE